MMKNSLIEFEAMKKLFLILILFLAGFAPLNAIAQDAAYLKNINITETPDSVELNLDSTSNIPYNVINYANGGVGIKLNNTNLDSNFNNSNPVVINKKQDLDSAQLYQAGSDSLEIRLNGNNNLANKKIKVNNTSRKSNIILIETPPEDEINYKPLSVTNTIKELPEIKNITFAPPPSSFAIENGNRNKPDVKTPISMYTERAGNPVANNKKLLAQATPENTKNILDLDNSKDNSLPINAPANTSTTTDPSAGNVTKPVNANTNDFTIPEKGTTSTTEEPSEKSKGIMDTVWDFINKNFIIVVSVLGVGVFLLIVLGIIIFLASRGKSHEDYPQYTEDMIAGQSDQSQGVVDNDPVNYIPPGPMETPQSVGEAISKIVFMKNRPGQ